MNLEEKLVIYRKRMQRKPQEEKIQETIRKSKEIFWESEQEKMLSYHEFLWIQFRLVRKRWWFLQLFLLVLTGATLISVYEDGYIQRSMGVMAVVFVILMIPELWKSRSCRCMEIEGAAYYSLRQIYAARMVLFGIVDILLLTAFCGTMTIGLRIAFTRLLVQFLLPMLVTACICFGTLCSKYIVNETIAVILCVFWCTVWLVITSNQEIYRVITLPVWLICIGISLLFLCLTVWRALYTCETQVIVKHTGR
ncbi:MAG: hypothetical protein HFH53_07835 [Hespellia sp.]|nr:hypothetical protein [Hespellia sp.]